MTAIQSLYVTIFTWLPVLIFAINKAWWVALLALVAHVVISWLLVFIVTANISVGLMKAWAWIKPPSVCSLILWVGWELF